MFDLIVVAKDSLRHNVLLGRDFMSACGPSITLDDWGKGNWGNEYCITGESQNQMLTANRQLLSNQPVSEELSSCYC